MKISALKKIYPYLKSDCKNIHWRLIRDDILSKSTRSRQRTCNCFLNATKYVLLNSNKGREILQKRIKVDSVNDNEPAYKFVLSPNGKDEIYRVTKSDYFDKYFDIYRKYNEKKYKSGNFKNASKSKNLDTALDIAVSKMISKHPSQKPWYLRIYDWPNNKKHEYNLPSRAFEWLTGIKPISIGEQGYGNYLRTKMDDVLALLKKLGEMDSKDYSFILMSGAEFAPRTETWHCLPILNVDDKNMLVHVIDKRKNKDFLLSYPTVLHNFKAIVGINWNEINNKK